MYFIKFGYQGGNHKSSEKIQKYKSGSGWEVIGNWMESGWKVDGKWSGSGLEVEWKWIRSGLEVDGKQMGS